MKSRKLLFVVMSLGLIVRLLYLWLGTKIYPARPDIFTDSDTWLWFNSFKNLYELGVYSSDLSLEYGIVSRTPGYSFFIGIFYVLFGGDKSLIFPAIGYAQLFLDVLAVWFVFKIVSQLFQSKKTALIAAFIYAFYPFVMVHNPVAYSESLSIFLLLLSFYAYCYAPQRLKWFTVGSILGIATLVRPQISLFIPLFGLILLYENRKSFSSIVKLGTLLTLGVLLTYGMWPLRNYINHKKIVLTQDLRGFSNWGEDVINFMTLMHSVKENWQPQFGQILRNEKVETPELLKRNLENETLFQETIKKAQHCSFGFSQWQTMGYWKKPLTEQGCTQEVANGFALLRQKVIEQYPFEYYVRIPLLNLRKALFKINLHDASKSNAFISLLFLYRSFLIFIGLAGSFLWLKSTETQYKPIVLLILVYFIGWYVLLCAGTGVQMRNIEMRYFLPADEILLFPAVYLIKQLLWVKNDWQQEGI